MADYHRCDSRWQFRQRNGEHNQDLAEEPRLDGGWHRRGKELESGVRITVRT